MDDPPDHLGLIVNEMSSETQHHAFRTCIKDVCQFDFTQEMNLMILMNNISFFDAKYWTTKRLNWDHIEMGWNSDAVESKRDLISNFAPPLAPQSKLLNWNNPEYWSYWKVNEIDQTEKCALFEYKKEKSLFWWKIIYFSIFVLARIYKQQQSIELKCPPPPSHEKKVQFPSTESGVV